MLATLETTTVMLVTTTTAAITATMVPMVGRTAITVVTPIPTLIKHCLTLVKDFYWAL